jgi:putative aldouronate transport system permease protein
MNMKASVHYHIMLLPGIVLLLMFSVYPMFGIIMAFQDFNPMKGFWQSSFVGLENFKYMFQIPDSKEVLRNTLVIAISKIIANLFVSVCFALLLHELRIRILKRAVQTIVYLPHFISWVLLGGILAQLLSLDGVFNQTLQFFGIDPVMFLGSNGWFRWIVVGSDVWKEFGFSAIIFLAALTNINPSLYEAADIDGASRWQKLKFITLPGIATMIVLVATLALQNILNAGFEQILNLYNPLVYRTGDIIDTYVYRIGLLETQYELATAVGLMKSIVSIVLIIISYVLASRYANYRIF